MEPLEILSPDQIDLNDNSRALIADVDEAARQVNEYRPLPQDVLLRIEDELIAERVYNSNAIEGNTLDFRETVLVLKQGIAGVPKKRDAMEARNLGEAVRLVSDWLGKDEQFHDPDRFLQVHGLLLREIDDDCAGRFRQRRVLITGARRQPPDHTIVRALVERVLETLTQPPEVGGLLLAAWAHWALARIHPFQDGNGRMARLWQDIVLLEAKLTCGIIRLEERREYLDALGDADEGEFNPLVQLLARRVASTFDLYIQQLGKDEDTEQFVLDLVGEADPRLVESRKLSYQRWVRPMEKLRNEFVILASKVNEASSELGIQIRKYQMIDQPAWQSILLGTGAPQTWYFLAEFSKNTGGGRKRLRYCFYFVQHRWTDEDNEQERSEHRVCLLASEDPGTGTFTRLDQISSCALTIREVFMVGPGFVRRRYDPGQDRDVYDRDIPPAKIAQDFFQEVVLSRFT